MTFEQIKTPDINNDWEINWKDLEALSSFSSWLKDDERDSFIGILEQIFLTNSDFRNSFLPLIRWALNNPNIDPKIKEIFEKAKYETELSIIRNINEEEILEYLKVFYWIDLNIEFQFIEENERKNVIKRFLEDLKIIFSELWSFNTEMIWELRKIRENMSFWTEKWKSDEYYKWLIIWSKIKTRITILLESVKTMYWEKISVWWIDYNKKDYEGLEKWFRKLDENFWINLFWKIPTRNFKSDFAKEIRLNLDKSGPDYNTIVAELNRLPQIVWNKWFERLKEVKLKNWNTVNLEDLYNSYNSLLSDFSQKNKVFYFGKMQAKNTDRWFWFEQARYNLWFDDIEEIYQEKLWNIDQMWFADLVIMLRLLVTMIPVVDIVWWFDDLSQASSWVNFDWSIQWIPENILMYITWILWITIVWWVIPKIVKWPKLAKILAKIPKILERLRSFPDYKKLMENENFRRILWFFESKLSTKVNKLKLSNFSNENNFYRVIVWDDAFKDIIESWVVRTNHSNKPKIGSINLTDRPTAFPSFSKWSVSIKYAQENPNHYIIVTNSSSIKPSTSGRHGKGSTMFPTDENGNHLKELSWTEVEVYKHVWNDEYELVYNRWEVIKN